MDEKLRKVVLYHGLESSDGWVRPRKKLNLLSFSPITDLDISGLDQVNQIREQLQKLEMERRQSKEEFDHWFTSKFIATKPTGILEHLAPKKMQKEEQ